MVKRLVFLGFALLLSSCQKKQKTTIGVYSCSDDSNRKEPLSLLVEAKNIDIPLPLGLLPVSHTVHEQIYCSIYKSTMTVDQLSSFFKEEMERYGWDINHMITPEHRLLYCKKPMRFCALVIRVISAKQVELTVFSQTLKRNVV